MNAVIVKRSEVDVKGNDITAFCKEEMAGFRVPLPYHSL
jgi:hypothetical protein